MESSERLVMELDMSTSRMEDLCSEADAIFAACIVQNLDKSVHRSEKSQPREKVTAGQWGEEIAEAIKGFKDAALREKSALPTDSEAGGSGSGGGSSCGGSLRPKRGGGGGGEASSSDDDSDEEMISDSTIQSELHKKGPVALTENVAMSILRKRVVAFQKSKSPGSNGTRKSQGWSHSAQQDGGSGIAAGGSSTSRGGEGSIHGTAGGGAVAAGHGRGARAAKGSGWKGKGRAKDERPRRSARSVGEKALYDGDMGVMEEIDDGILAEVFRYWASKREGYGGPMLRCLHYIPGAVMWKRVEDPQREVRSIGCWCCLDSAFLICVYVLHRAKTLSHVVCCSWLFEHLLVVFVNVRIARGHDYVSTFTEAARNAVGPCRRHAPTHSSHTFGGKVRLESIFQGFSVNTTYPG